MSFDDSGAPSLPPELTPYNSYLDGPVFQKRFTIFWCSVLAAAVVTSSTYIFKAVQNGKFLDSLTGIREEWYRVPRTRPAIDEIPQTKSGAFVKIAVLVRAIGNAPMLGWRLPLIGLNFGQVILIAAYFATTLVCVIFQAPLIENPNRAGFIALAHLPPIFLFACKNSILPILFGPDFAYDKLNWIHRYLGRGLLVAATIHGVLWIKDHLYWKTPILGQQKEVSGIATFGVLCILVLLSFKPVRVYAYGFFRVMHIITYVAMFISLCYHTIYAVPWIFPPLAFYGFDLFMRMMKTKVKDATLEPIDNQMTLIRIKNCTSGWTAGQHVRLRIFFNARFMESHPLSIACAPKEISCLTEGEAGEILLGARVKGDWSRALNCYASSEISTFCSPEKEKEPDATKDTTTSSLAPVQVLIDGPYGGPTIDLGDFETILLFCGGSGVTFCLGLLDDIVGRCLKLSRTRGERTKRIEFSWCVRSFGTMEWFTSQLQQIANVAASSETLDLHISLYVTCLCDPEAIPIIPNCDVTIVRPSLPKVLEELLTPPSTLRNNQTFGKTSHDCSSSSTPLPPDIEAIPRSPKDSQPISSGSSSVSSEPSLPRLSEKLDWVGLGGGVGIAVAGPESLIREATHAVGRIRLLREVELGGVGLCSEVYAV